MLISKVSDPRLFNESKKVTIRQFSLSRFDWLHNGLGHDEFQ